MAVVSTPRNNLQHHLAWFNTQKPQVPPRTQSSHRSLQQTVAIANLPPVLVNPEISQPIAANRNDTARSPIESSSMPTPANLRSSKLAAPRRSEPKPKKQQENENIYPEVPAASAVFRGNSLVERVKNAWVQEGKIVALPT